MYSTCLTVQEPRLWVEPQNDRDTCMGLYHPSAFFVKVDPALNSLPFPLREQSHHRGKEAKNASPSPAVECFVSGIHDPNPPVQECCPTLGQKTSTDRAKRASFFRNSQTLLIQKDKGGKGSNTKGGSSSFPKRAELKS